MIELTLASYSEAQVRAYQNAGANRIRIRKKVSLRALRSFIEDGRDVDLMAAGSFPVPLVGDRETLAPGAYISVRDLHDMGVTDVLVRCNGRRTLLHLELTKLKLRA